MVMKNLKLKNKKLFVKRYSFVNYYDPQVVDFNNFFDDLPRFNNLTGNWSLDDGYVDQGYNSYPQRTAFSSARNAFFAFLQGYEHNFEYACRSFKQGYKVSGSDTRDAL